MLSSNSSSVDGNGRLLKQLSKYAKLDNPLKLIHVVCSFNTNPLVAKYFAKVNYGIPRVRSLSKSMLAFFNMLRESTECSFLSWLNLMLNCHVDVYCGYSPLLLNNVIQIWISFSRSMFTRSHNMETDMERRYQEIQCPFQ